MKGWECPKCGRCYAPAVTECMACAPAAEASGTGSPWVLRWNTCPTCGALVGANELHICSRGVSGPVLVPTVFYGSFDVSANATVYAMTGPYAPLPSC